MTCPYTAKVKHYLSLLKHGKTDGLRCLITVGSHKDNVAVSSDTYGLTGILLYGVESCTDLTVNYKHGVNADSLTDVALICGIIALVAYLYGAVLHNGKITVSVTLALGGNVYTVHNKGTRRLTVYHIVI